MSEQCARDSNGNLKDATDITFYESESDEKALPPVSGAVPSRRSTRTRNTEKLTTSLAAEKADDDGNAPAQRRSNAGAPRPRIKHVPESTSDEEGEDFDDLPVLEDVSYSSDEGESDSEDFGVDHDEIAYLLASKTIPARAGKSSKQQTRAKPTAPKCRRPTIEEVADEEDLERPAKAQNHSKSRRATVEEVEDEDDLPKATSTVPKNENGSVGDPGDKHYKCRHRNRKIITITKGMRYNVTSMFSFAFIRSSHNINPL
ncbi:hypothetical protein B0H13DRAFT_1853473 [Mycena leptocephala]|nr:hypothetical protein B0H13DRAFT_1853473 [Mycena leptocephala]